jgi:hypothetical protein
MKKTPQRIWAKQPRVDLSFVPMKNPEPYRTCAVGSVSEPRCDYDATYTLAGRPWLPVCSSHAVAITTRWESERGQR